MRRCVLGTFLLLAACGSGGLSSPSGATAVDPGAERARIAFTSDGREALRSYAEIYGDDAVHSCFAAWIDEAGTPSLYEPVAKPDVQALRQFLCTCIGATDCL